MAFDFDITLVDTGGFLPTATANLLIANTEAALLEWGRFLDGLGSIEVEVRIEDTVVGRFGGASGGSVIIGSDGTTDILEATTGHELRTGFDANGTDPDALIVVDPDFLASAIWLDPTPFDRSDSPPVDLTDGVGTLMHEFAHALGINGFIDTATFQPMPGFQTNYDQLVTVSGGQPFFIGATTVEAYGGPLPLTALSPTQNVYHFGDQAGAGPELTNSIFNGTVFFTGERYEIDALTLMVLGDLGLSVSIPDDLPFTNPLDFPPQPVLQVVDTAAANGQVTASLSLSASSLFAVGATVALSQPDGTMAGDPMRVLLAPGDTQTSFALAVPAGIDPESLTLVVTNPSEAVLTSGTRSLSVPLGDGGTPGGGTEGPDLLTGTAAAESFFAFGGNDTITPGAGNDLVDGGAGLDVVVFSGALGESNVSVLADGRVVVLGPDGRDVLTDVEQLSFADQTVETALLGTTPSPLPPSEAVDVFRFFNSGAGGHFFTTSPAERDAVLGLEGFNFEGAGFRALAAEHGVEGAVDVFRFFNTNAGGHFFTTDPAERDAAMAIDGFIFEQVGFRAFAEQVVDSVPVYRFFNTNAGGHFFSTSIDEVDAAEDIPGFQLEGVGFYAFPEDLIG